MASTDVAVRYRRYQIMVAFVCFMSYTALYFTRRSLNFVIPALLQDPDFAGQQLTQESVGLAGSSMSMAYALGKLLFGYLADIVPPKYLLAFATSSTALMNLLCASSSSWNVIVAACFLNGLFQSAGWPACARLLLMWFPPSTRGTWWGSVSTSQSFGAALVAVVCSWASELHGWRVAMLIPVALALSMSIVSSTVPRSPQYVDLPPIEEPISKPTSDARKSHWERIKSTLKDPAVIMLCLAMFFVYIIRQGLSEWVVLYVVERKHWSVSVAGRCMFWFEVGGAVGSPLSGLLSDRLFNGRRGPINLLFALSVAPALVLLWAAASQISFTISLFFCGVAVYGPQMLLGVHLAELVDRRIASTVQGLSGLVAGIGASAAGWPLAMTIKWYGWDSFFFTLVICVLLSMIPMLFVIGRRQKPQKDP